MDEAGDSLPALSPRRQRFVDELCVDWCMNRAARAAGYSEANASKQAHRLMEDPTVAAHIEMRLAMHREESEVRREQIAQVLIDVGLRYDVSHIVGIDPRSLPPAIARCIKSVKARHHPDGSVTYAYELHDRLAALAQLAKLYGLNEPERHAIETPEPLPTRGANADWRDGLTDDELAAWGAARAAGNLAEAERLRQLGSNRVARAVAQRIHDDRSTRR